MAYKTLVIVLFLISCAGTGFGSYSTDYIEGQRATNRFVKELKKKNIPYRVVQHQDAIFEVQYKEPKSKD